VFILDWFGFVYTIRGNFISTGNSAFFLSVITGMIVDVTAFIWVMFVMATSCHWDCKNMWYRWRNQSCPLETSKRIKKLLCTVMFAPILCIANHFHYIILAFISDPYHAGSITIAYGLSFFLHYFVFRQFYARVALHSNANQIQIKNQHEIWNHLIVTFVRLTALQAHNPCKISNRIIILRKSLS